MVAGSIEDFFKIFEEKSKQSREVRYMFTGNVLNAVLMNRGRGKIIFFTDNTGAEREGILMPADWKPATFAQQRSITLSTPENVAKLVFDERGSANSSEGVVIRGYSGNLAEVSLPTIKSKQLLLNHPRIKEILDNLGIQLSWRKGQRSVQFVVRDKDAFIKLIGVYMGEDIGITFKASFDSKQKAAEIEGINLNINLEGEGATEQDVVGVTSEASLSMGQTKTPLQDPLKPYQKIVPKHEASVDDTMPPWIYVRDGLGIDIWEAARRLGFFIVSTTTRGEDVGVLGSIGLSRGQRPGKPWMNIISKAARNANVRTIAEAREQQNKNTFEVQIGDPRWVRTISHEVGHGFAAIIFQGKDNLPFAKLFAKSGYSPSELQEEAKRLSSWVRPEPGNVPVDWSDTNSDYIKYRLKSQELLADFFSAYFMMPEQARSIAPRLTEVMEELLRSNSDLVEALRMIHGQPHVMTKDIEPVEAFPVARPEPVATPAPKGVVVPRDPQAPRACVHAFA